MNLAVVDTIHSKGNKFVTGVKIKATGESKHTESPGFHLFSIQLYKKNTDHSLNLTEAIILVIISLHVHVDQTSLLHSVICFVKIKQYERQTD